MKKLILSVLCMFTVLISIAQTVVEPTATVPESTGTSAWVKMIVAVVAIAIMSLLFYMFKNFNKKKQSEAK